MTPEPSGSFRDFSVDAALFVGDASSSPILAALGLLRDPSLLDEVIALTLMLMGTSFLGGSVAGGKL